MLRAVGKLFNRDVTQNPYSLTRLYMGVKMMLRAVLMQEVTDEAQIVCRMVLSRYLKLEI